MSERSLACRLCVLGLLVGSVAHSATYHGDAQLRQPCTDCHTEHYEEGGGLPQGTDTGGPFEELLVRATTNRLCLFCHDGTDITAPDVFAPVNSYASTGDEHSGAGFFQGSVGTKNDLGHDLGVPSTDVPFSSIASMELSCASCHDPHGSDNYRNLLSRPAGNVDVPLRVGVEVFVDDLPSDPPTLAATALAYRESNTGYRAAISRWCMTCHDQLLPGMQGSQEGHHHTDVSLAAAGAPTDPNHWIAGVGVGFGASTGDAVEGIPRVRFEVPTATDRTTAHIPAASNEVMCPTCHLAHGSAFEHGMTWPHEDSGSPVDRDSGCQQCHNF